MWGLLNVMLLSQYNEVVAVDIRPDLSTYGKWFSVELSEENKKQFWIPPGMASGFLVMSDFKYKCTDFYNPEYERSLM